MKPWIHPQERRSRIYWTIQIAIVVVVMIGMPILLLQQPTADHIGISIGIVVVGLVTLVISLRQLKKLPQEYPQAEGQDMRPD